MTRVVYGDLVAPQRCREPDIDAFDRRTDAINAAFDREFTDAAVQGRKPRTAAEIIATITNER